MMEADIENIKKLVLDDGWDGVKEIPRIQVVELDMVRYWCNW